MIWSKQLSNRVMGGQSTMPINAIPHFGRGITKRWNPLQTLYDLPLIKKGRQVMPVNIHGKEYKTVAERIGELNDLNYSLNTELVSWEKNVVIMKATLTITGDDGDVNTYTGHAYEHEGSSQINKTSALENCETSAIGRALAAAGFGGTEYASANEVENAIHQQTSSIHAQDKGKFDRNAKIGFGKHQNVTWKEADAGYLAWVVDNMDNKLYVSFANAELDARANV